MIRETAEKMSASRLKKVAKGSDLKKKEKYKVWRCGLEILVGRQS